MVQPSTVRRLRRPAEVVRVVCPTCRGTGSLLAGDDPNWPHPTRCYRCKGSGFVVPPGGGAAAALVALVAEPAGFRGWEDAQDPSPAA